MPAENFINAWQSLTKREAEERLSEVGTSVSTYSYSLGPKFILSGLACRELRKLKRSLILEERLLMNY